MALAQGVRPHQGADDPPLALVEGLLDRAALENLPRKREEELRRVEGQARAGGQDLVPEPQEELLHVCADLLSRPPRNSLLQLCDILAVLLECVKELLVLLLRPVARLALRRVLHPPALPQLFQLLLLLLDHRLVGLHLDLQQLPPQLAFLLRAAEGVGTVLFLAKNLEAVLVCEVEVVKEAHHACFWSGNI